MENKMENGGQEGQRATRTENMAEIRELRDKLEEMKTIIDNMERYKKGCNYSIVYLLKGGGGNNSLYTCSHTVIIIFYDAKIF